MEMEITIATNPRVMSALDLKEFLERQPAWKSADVTLSTHKALARTRGLEPTLLVAIVGAAGAGLGALIAGLFQVLREKSAKRIVIQAANGRRMEFPAGLSEAEINVLVEKLKMLDEAPQIIVE
jgi:predicted ribonuclease YlaK